LFPKRSHTSSDHIPHFHSHLDSVDSSDFIPESEGNKSPVFELSETLFCKFRTDFHESFGAFANGTAIKFILGLVYTPFIHISCVTFDRVFTLFFILALFLRL
jgi:hypothetical protein